MEISHLDDFKLEVEQQLYELDENDEDISYEGWLYLRYQTVQHERDVRSITWCMDGDH